MKNEGVFRPSDLPIMHGKVYHLDLKPEELARNIIIVGDPERVPFIAEEYFTAKEVDRFHRGLRTITGFVKETAQRVSIVTSGMGTPSLEIIPSITFHKKAVISTMGRNLSILLIQNKISRAARNDKL
jgi:hypothetical protein